jgi:hypothetical protein
MRGMVAKLGWQDELKNLWRTLKNGWLSGCHGTGKQSAPASGTVMTSCAQFMRGIFSPGAA